MRHSFIKKNLQDRINTELRRAALLAQAPGQSTRIDKTLNRAMKIEAYAAVNAA